jgi:hypothetical protein
MKMRPKHPQLVTVLELFTGRKRDGRHCMTCGSAAMDDSDFRDDLSRREASISGMCQPCQNSVFDHPEEA